MKYHIFLKSGDGKIDSHAVTDFPGLLRALASVSTGIDVLKPGDTFSVTRTE